MNYDAQVYTFHIWKTQRIGQLPCSKWIVIFSLFFKFLFSTILFHRPRYPSSALPIFINLCNHHTNLTYHSVLLKAFFHFGLLKDLFICVWMADFMNRIIVLEIEDLSYASSFLSWSHWSELSWSMTGSQELLPGLACGYRGSMDLSYFLLPSLAGSKKGWRRNGEARTQMGAHMGCWYHRMED